MADENWWRFSEEKENSAATKTEKTLFGSSKPSILLYTVCTLCSVKYEQSVFPGCNGNGSNESQSILKLIQLVMHWSIKNLQCAVVPLDHIDPRPSTLPWVD